MTFYLEVEKWFKTIVIENNSRSSTIGSYHHQVAILVLNDKLDCFGQ